MADNPQESGSNNLPAHASDLIQPPIVEGLYILTNKKSRTVLELEGGNVNPGTALWKACQSWERRTDEGIDQQFWVSRRCDTNGSYRFMSLCGPLYLDLEGGQEGDNARIIAHKYVNEGVSRLHQEWKISRGREGCCTIQCAKSNTYLEIQNGKPDNGIKVTCSKREINGDHQVWDLERTSRTTIEITAIIEAWKPDLLPRLFQPHEDSNEYFILPPNLRNTIWNGTKLLRQAVRKSTFDYDSFVIKAKDAVNTWVRDRLKVDGYSVLFGIVFGVAEKGPKAYNWYLSPDMKTLVFFDAQTGKEYTTAGLDDFVFVPSFIMF